MANRRMISKSISTSRKLAKVSDFAALLFTWLIPHTDDGGNMDADPIAVRGTAVPMRDKVVDDIEKALVELEKAGLIIFYEAKNGGSTKERFLHIVKSENHQTLRGDRPDFRFPPVGKPVGNRRSTGGKRNRTEQNITKRNVTEQNASAHQKTTSEVLSKEESQAKGLLDFWNQTHGSEYVAYKPITKNLAYWLTVYSWDQICKAVVAVKFDKFWRDKMTPTVFLRQGNPNGERVDRIGDLLNLPSTRGNVVGGGKPVSNIK